MEPNLSHDDALKMLKALADASRLYILRLLADKEFPVGELAREMNLSEPTISHHLAILRESGFVSLRMDGNLRWYRVNRQGLERFKNLISTVEQKPDLPKPAADRHAWIEALDWPAEDAAILRDHTDGARLTKLPKKRRKTSIILRWIATLFEEGRVYNEAEVNEVLMGVYKEDYVSLRRDLIDYGFLRRKAGGSKYWRESSGG